MADYMLVLHEVENYDVWRPYFNSSKFLRDDNGIKKTSHVLREQSDKNDVVILMELDNVKKAQEFSQSQELKDVMRMAGVVGKPEIYFLSN